MTTLPLNTLVTTPYGLGYIDRVLSATMYMCRIKFTDFYKPVHVDHILPYEGEYIPGSATEPPEYWIDNEDDEVPF